MNFIPESQAWLKFIGYPWRRHWVKISLFFKNKAFVGSEFMTPFCRLFYTGWRKFYDVIEQCFKELRIVGHESPHQLNYSTSFFFLDIVFSLSKKKMKDWKEVFYHAEIGPGLMCSTCLPLTWGLSIGGNDSELKTRIRKAFKISSRAVLAERGA